MDDALEWIKLLASLLTPLVVLVLGFRISRKLEESKTRTSKEHEWESYWATSFLRVANDYNNTATKLITMMARLAEYANNNDIAKANEIITEMNDIVGSFSSLDWELQQYSDFALVNGPVVRTRGKVLFEAVTAMLRDKKADLEEIRRMQFEFTDSVRLAHAEILSLPANRELDINAAPRSEN